MVDEVNIELGPETSNESDSVKYALKLTATGVEIGASAEVIEEIVSEFKRNPAIWNYAYLEKKLLCKAWGLPESASNTNFTTGDIIDFAANLDFAGGDREEILQSDSTWNRIKLRGRSAKKEATEVVKETWARKLGVPEASIDRLSFDDFTKAIEGLQYTGGEGAVTRPEFWEGYLQNRKKGGADLPFLKNWAEKIEKEEKQVRDQKLANAIREYNRAVEKHEKEVAELNKLREEDRRKRALKERKKKRRKSARIKKRPRATVSTIPEDITISIIRQVSTPWGTNYIIRAYSNDKSEMLRINEDGSVEVVLKLGFHAYQVSHHDSGMPYVVPVIGRRTANRRSSPMDLPGNGRRGPIGID